MDREYGEGGRKWTDSMGDGWAESMGERVDEQIGLGKHEQIFVLWKTQLKWFAVSIPILLIVVGVMLLRELMDIFHW